MEKREGYSWVSFGKNLCTGSRSPRRLRDVNTAKKGSRCAIDGPKLMVIAAWPRMKEPGGPWGLVVRCSYPWNS